MARAQDITLFKLLVEKNQHMVVGNTILKRLLALEEIYDEIELTREEFFILVKDIENLVPVYIKDLPNQLQKLLLESAMDVVDLSSDDYYNDDMIHEISEWMGYMLQGDEYLFCKEKVSEQLIMDVCKDLRQQIFKYISYPVEFVGWRGDLNSKRMVAEFLIIKDGIFVPA